MSNCLNGRLASAFLAALLILLAGDIFLLDLYFDFGGLYTVVLPVDFCCLRLRLSLAALDEGAREPALERDGIVIKSHQITNLVQLVL